ncbi:CRISPR-associated endonuclease Csn1 [Eubacterium ruminantium]|nr:CRISPR-associated endonuclease Csn1 [Eubacterium ruminantium]
MVKKEYFIGLDMGTSSVGWAVADTNYNLLRAKGKDMWGVRLFPEASTAADRRSHRTARRNNKRKAAREGFLREIFEDEINKIDPGFFERLKESKYYLEDKLTDTPFVLFADKGYTDKEYYDEYPTVFHLIKELISEKGLEPHDIRLVYLACLNIYKHRGHFLNDTLSGDGIDNINSLCNDFTSYLADYNQNSEDDGTEKMDLDSTVLAGVFEETLCNKHLSNSAKKRDLIDKLGITNKTKYLTEMMALISGLASSVSNMFAKDTYDEEQKKFKLSFRSSNLDEDMVKVQAMLTPEEYEMICIMKKIHDWSVVSVIMGSHKYISDARVELYEKHKQDLAKLKAIYKEYLPDKYDAMFREMTDNSYSAYVGKVSSNKKSQTGNHKVRMQRRGAKCKQEDFYDRIKKEINSVPQEEKIDILQDMETNSFLPKQLTNENGVIPYQLHLAELKKILDNASTYLPFLNSADETGISNKDKIIQLFEFRIPYYVGPLFKSEKNKTNAWVVRKESGKVYPWNFNEKIDEKQSAEIFIERMVRHCTYLNNESALPKNSLKYERFRVLNELNNLRINGERISPELKQRIYNELFKVKKKRITKSMLCEYLYKNGIADKDSELSGFDGTFANALLSYGKFRELFNVDTLTDKQEAAAEDIIKWSTVYGDSKKFLQEKIEENYGPESENPLLDNKQIKRVMGYKFTDWGNLSREFLNLEGADKDNDTTTGEVMPLITRMWEENYNLMELMSNKFSYRDALAEKTEEIEKTLTDIEYEDLEDLYISAPVKRMTWQTLLILKEIYQIMGYAPKKIFVEMAREEEEKVNGKGARKSSRKKRLEDLYRNCKDASKELSTGIKNADEAILRRKKLYLYYLQKGKCMYSGKTIDFKSLFTNNYDIDHIYPQSVVKDDSLENNMVLVERNYNNKKSDTFPIFSDWQNKMKPFWTMLKEQGFINEEKYKRLTRTDELTDDELANFVNRQLVETRQATKVIAELLKNSFDDIDSKIVYAKAGNVSEFRHKFSMKYDKETEKSSVIHPELVKCRIINDFHHANDSYLNIVVGNIYDVKFTQNPYNYIKEYKKQKNNSALSEQEKEKYHMDKIFNFDVKRNGEVAWISRGDNKTLETVLKVMRKNTPIVTRMNFEEHGQLADLTIYSASDALSKKGVGYIKVKASDARLDVLKYGGYKKYKGAYFFLVEHTEKNKRVRTIENMPLYLKNELNTKEKIELWCADKENGLGLVDPDVRLGKIKLYSKIRIDGFDLYLTGRTGNNLLTSNAVQLKIGSNKPSDNDKLFWRYYINKLSKYTENSEFVSIQNNIKLYDLFVEINNAGVYSKRQNPIGDKLLEGRSKFINLTLSKQVETLLGIIRIYSLENQGADLSNIGGQEKNGTMKPHKRISDKKEVLLINQSVTGLYESKIDLLKI